METGVTGQTSQTVMQFVEGEIKQEQENVTIPNLPLEAQIVLTLKMIPQILNPAMFKLVTVIFSFVTFLHLEYYSVLFSNPPP